MKLALMAETGRIGNLNRETGLPDQWADAGKSAQPKGSRKMTISAQSIVYFADFRRGRAVRWIFAAAVLAAMAGAPDRADANVARGAGAYDGVWNVTFATQAGNCSSTNSVPFTVAGTRLSSAGGGKVTGGISRAGIVSVRISVGASVATGSGRLAGNSGTGRWSGIITGDKCSGSWQATRS
jgi:hypothetical protein